jgi:hypothetical protein
MVRGAARLRMASVFNAIIKPPPNQGDDYWHLWKKTIGFSREPSVFSKIKRLPFFPPKFENWFFFYQNPLDKSENQSVFDKTDWFLIFSPQISWIEILHWFYRFSWFL